MTVFGASWHDSTQTANFEMKNLNLEILTNPTMTTPQARFTDACATFVQGQILPPLVEFIRTKNCTVTVQELAGALQLPTPAPAPVMQGVQVPTIPGFTQT